MTRLQRITRPTRRLLLRPWRDADADPFVAMNADPRVTEFLPPANREQTLGMIERIRRHWDEKGFGLWAIEVPGVTAFAGFVGLSTPRFEAHFTPAVEVGWRLAFEHWGQGYATEGAAAALDAGFDELGLDEIVSMTVPANVRSRRVMEKLGMQRHPSDDFDHAMLAEGDPLRRHVLYRLRRSERPPRGGE